jgi:hypothetical protein
MKQLATQSYPKKKKAEEEKKGAWPATLRLKQISRAEDDKRFEP